MSFLTLKNITKSFGPNTVVRDFDLNVASGEFVSFLGPSGCGKTTVLRMIAGFETPSSGSIHVGGMDVTALPASRRKIGMVFQAYALFPNMSVRDNVAFGLKIAGMPRAEIDTRVAEMLDLISLGSLADRYPYQMSGGQQQRVALARALAPRPNLLLLDEPLSALDAQIRTSLRDDIRRIQQELGITTVFVTHDQEEALSISDRVVVMHKGRADQIGTPAQIYNRPTTRFVADFVGKLNTFEARVESPQSIFFAGQNIHDPRHTDLTPGAPITVALRPEALSLRPRPGDDLSLPGRVLHSTFLGSVIRAQIEVAGQQVSVDMFNRADATLPVAGDMAEVWFTRGDVLVLPSVM
ncbi:MULTISPECIES: ABC transporter ATP-binding protein [Roseobacteraceae]|uniref:ABC transporter ATP-binding protein n=1 Tax=Roseobacteraceae TaxID=2854170 RepID=UPI00125F8D10|nr:MULTISPECIES: ABC transporter ATP-binding protein [Roseobacteraceae]MBU0642895.1 ABC transporter ATP-binding protein [Alphaproteobacteria bacterium]KAB6716455.1 spermidine/putrescine ABC transporter ATP-binding protein [Roseobacter sp. TSBP12]MBU1280158.1 ABC transporter ATP-binding protein [Alphaproteobacteria bacterium]MBU1575368.1 ABC transporter ATP-binding protein [Alphaproteobacteria bacterium]MBU1829597.1 ABC transporter ATP-binding protein [Alphaproteobacteria bacterium]|tara:strand:- start:1021 stop:2079 length:1059 start_codon:yes stop_codon:yes gene_type:complete